MYTIVHDRAESGTGANDGAEQLVITHALPALNALNAESGSGNVAQGQAAQIPGTIRRFLHFSAGTQKNGVCCCCAEFIALVAYYADTAAGQRLAALFHGTQQVLIDLFNGEPPRDIIIRAHAKVTAAGSNRCRSGTLALYGGIHDRLVVRDRCRRRGTCTLAGSGYGFNFRHIIVLLIAYTSAYTYRRIGRCGYDTNFKRLPLGSQITGTGKATICTLLSLAQHLPLRYPIPYTDAIEHLFLELTADLQGILIIGVKLNHCSALTRLLIQGNAFD